MRLDISTFYDSAVTARQSRRDGAGRQWQAGPQRPSICTGGHGTEP